MKIEEYEYSKKRAMEYFHLAHIILTEKEKEGIEVADFGLNDLEHIGLQIVTYVNTQQCCAKEMVLFPRQTCPEHRHAPLKELKYLGKEETFRCRYGSVYLYVEGEGTENISVRVPKGYENTYTVFHEIILRPGEQYTINPDTRHWFSAGDEGAVISEFSTMSRDEYDIFTDENINRMSDVQNSRKK